MGRRIRDLYGGDIAPHGAQAAFAKRAGLRPQDLNRYERGRVPRSDVLFRIAEAGKVTMDWLLKGGPEPPQKKNDWQDQEWQATHSFTAMVEALRRLERFSATDARAWQTRLAWEAVLSAAEIVLKIAGWTDAEWRRVYEEGLDHWLRPKRGRRSEQELLTERLQTELGFRWEEETP